MALYSSRLSFHECRAAMIFRMEGRLGWSCLSDTRAVVATEKQRLRLPPDGVPYSHEAWRLQPVLPHADTSVGGRGGGVRWTGFEGMHRQDKARTVIEDQSTLLHLAFPVLLDELADQTWRTNSPFNCCSHSSVPWPGNLTVQRLLNIPFVGCAVPMHAHRAACQEKLEVNNKGTQQELLIKCPTLSPTKSCSAASVSSLLPTQGFL